MKKILLGILGLGMYSLSFSDIYVKIHEPMRFKTHNTRAVSSSLLMGEGVLEIYTDNEKEDIGKKIEFKFPNTTLMTNKKRQIEVKDFSLEKKENSMIVSKGRELVKIYAFIEKKSFEKVADAELVSGEYVGEIPIILSVYRKMEGR